MGGAPAGGGSGGKQEDAMEALVRREFKQWQLEQAKVFFKMFCILFLIFHCLMFVNIAFGVERWFSQSQDIIFLMGFLIALLIDASPHFLNHRTAPIIHTMIMVLQVCFVSPVGATSASSLTPVLGSYLTLPRLISVFLSDRTWIFVFWNFTLSATVVYTYAYHSDSAFDLGMRALIGTELTASMVSISVFSMLVQMKRTGLRHNVEITSRKRERSAMTALLETTTDVVVELDEALSICEDSPKLSNLLLNRSDRSLKGSTIHMFMPSEADRDRYLEQMAASMENEIPVSQVMHAHIRDGQGDEVKVQLIHVKFDLLDGQVRHLIGIREFPDVPGLPRLPSETSAKPPEFRAAGTSAAPAPAPGTPPRVQSGFLPRRPRSAASEASSRNSQKDIRLALPSFKPTDYKCKLFQVATMLMSWNFSITSSRCCLFHSALGELRKVVSRMNAEACRLDYVPMSGWQCQHCGLLDLNDSEADRLTGRCLTCKMLYEPSPPRQQDEPEAAAKQPPVSVASL